MLKQFVAFIWDINRDSGIEGGWDHVVKAEDGTPLSWDTFVEVSQALKELIPIFCSQQLRLAEIKAQIVDLKNGTVVPYP